MFTFSIEAIHAGWFDVKISNETKEAFLSNSWYLNNDAPKILLNNLNDLAGRVLSSCWLCWHDEPGASIWHLNKEEDILQYTIADAVKDSIDLCCEGIALSNEEIFAEIISGYIPFNDFYAVIVKAMNSYSRGTKLETYNKEWETFPFAELYKAIEILHLT